MLLKFKRFKNLFGSFPITEHFLRFFRLSQSLLKFNQRASTDDHVAIPNCRTLLESPKAQDLPNTKNRSETTDEPARSLSGSPPPPPHLPERPDVFDRCFYLTKSAVNCYRARCMKIYEKIKFVSTNKTRLHLFNLPLTTSFSTRFVSNL